MSDHPLQGSSVQSDAAICPGLSTSPMSVAKFAIRQAANNAHQYLGQPDYHQKCT